MSNLSIFNFENHKIRVATINNEPWFVLTDVCKILEIPNVSQVKSRLDKGVINTYPLATNGGIQEVTVINEDGLYDVILESRKPEAKRIRKWVTSGVLPSIRKTGAYMTPEVIEQTLLNPDFIIQIATQLKAEQSKRQQAEAKLEEAKPKLVFAEAVETSNTSILIGELAKILKQNGINIGQNRLFNWLRDNEYIHKNKNIPTQKAMDLDLFSIKETAIAKPDGTPLLRLTPKVTGKGQTYFISKFLNNEIRN